MALMHAPVLRDVESIRQYLKAQNPSLGLSRADETRATGIPEIDRLLDGGLPKGAITVFTGSSGAGRMTIAAQAAAEETRAGRAVAWVDASGTLYPPALHQAGVDLSRVLMVRGVRERALFAAEQILASGAFGLVVVSGLDSLSQAALRRVQTSSEGSNASAVLILESHASASVTNAALKLKIARRASGIQVEVEKSRSELVGRRTLLETPRLGHEQPVQRSRARSPEPLPLFREEQLALGAPAGSRKAQRARPAERAQEASRSERYAMPKLNEMTSLRLV